MSARDRESPVPPRAHPLRLLGAAATPEAGPPSESEARDLDALRAHIQELRRNLVTLMATQRVRRAELELELARRLSGPGGDA